MTNAIRASEEMNDGCTTWDLSLTPKDFFKTYFYPYLQISSECDPESQQECTTIHNRVDLRNNDNNLYGINAGRYYGVVLNNGIMIWINKYENKGQGFIFIVDINGDSKPNRNARDIFGFCFTKDGFHGYSHYGFKQNSRYNMSGGYGGCNVNACCSWMGAGGGCSQMIIYDGWQISKDYPW